MFRRISSAVVKDLKRVFTPGTIACIVIGTAIASFGLHNVHQRTGITEGGVLGMILLESLVPHSGGHCFAGSGPLLLSAGFPDAGKGFPEDFRVCVGLPGRMVFPVGETSLSFPGFVGKSASGGHCRGAVYRCGRGTGGEKGRILRRRRRACHGHIQGAEVPDRGGVSLYRCDGPSLIAYVPAGPQDRIFPDHRDPVVYAS